MARFRLQYQSSHVELLPGEFSIGRSAACNLSVFDTLVSRRHAKLHVGPDGVTIEDLGSRNGVVVNGEAIKDRCRLTHMDCMYVGSQELILIDASKVTDHQETAQHLICNVCGAVNGVDRRHCGECGRSFEARPGDTIKEPRTSDHAQHAWEEPEVTNTAQTRDVIGGIASKAIRMGRYEAAERMLLRHLDMLLERAVLQQPLSNSEEDDPKVVFATANGHALQLAEGLRDPKWIDWVFRIHLATRRLMDAETIEAMHALIRSQEYRRRKYVRTYLQVIQEQASEYGASERFLARRVEGLAEVILAR